MISASTLLLFLAACLALLLSPGPNMAFVVSHGVAQGPRAGFAAALGIGLADLVYTALTAAGLTAAVADTFAEHAGPLLVIGTDAPTLTPANDNGPGGEPGAVRKTSRAAGHCTSWHTGTPSRSAGPNGSAAAPGTSGCSSSTGARGAVASTPTAAGTVMSRSTVTAARTARTGSATATGWSLRRWTGDPARRRPVAGPPRLRRLPR